MSRPLIYTFGPCALDAGAFRLTIHGKPVQASPKVLDLLRYLLERPSTLVTKEELFRTLWPDVIVSDNALTQAVSELRQALGDNPSDPKYISNRLTARVSLRGPGRDHVAAYLAAADI